MTELYKKWDIWLAKIKFEDSQEIKARPVLIVQGDAVFVLSLKMTSQAKHSDTYSILEWKKAGLLKPTYIRLSKFMKLQNNDFVHKIGRLSEVDIGNLMSILPNS